MPTQLALVFFGILHVPLNVPALGVSLGEDNVKLDRELVAHGASNLLAGLTGTVPNYLTYVNTVLCELSPLQAYHNYIISTKLTPYVSLPGWRRIEAIGPHARCCYRRHHDGRSHRHWVPA